MDERTLQRLIWKAATERGWICFHSPIAQFSRQVTGFPDLVLTNPIQHRTMFVELKSARGKLSEAQQAWLGSLTMSGMSAHVWRPAQWESGEILKALDSEGS